MKLTKYEHACLFLENEQGALVIDPGSFSNLPSDLVNIKVVVVTEEHMDHYNEDNLKKILEQSPEVKIYSTTAVCDQLKKVNIDCTVVEGSKIVNESGFDIKFVEGDHAPTYKKSPCRVLTITIGNFLYYPSDSFITTDEEVQVLALPTSGPWHKLEEAIDFANKVKSNVILATHNFLYSDTGQDVANHFITMNIADKDREWAYLEVGESKEL